MNDTVIEGKLFWHLEREIEATPPLTFYDVFYPQIARHMPKIIKEKVRVKSPHFDKVS